jgi:nitroreductase
VPQHKFTPLADYREYTPADMIKRSTDFYEEMRRRRTVRFYSPRAIPMEVIENCINTAATAPSGANRQPWHYAVVTDPQIKQQIRNGAEKIEEEFYSGESTKNWVEDLEQLGTDAHKPFLETAPCLIVIFAERHGISETEEKTKNYYVSESVGIATGMLISAVHHAGLVSLTYTPAKMKFLNTLLSRPENEKPYMILVVGYPADDAEVPIIRKKSLDQISTFFK